MKSQSKPPRMHHYIPRFYLAGFAAHSSKNDKSKPLLWVYEKHRAIRCSTPEAEACQKDFYSFQDGGARNVEVEGWFARLEGQVSSIIPELVRLRREPTGPEREWLALFMGTMQTRTPMGRRLSDERFGPATSRLMKEAAADPARFRELCVTMQADIPDAEMAEEVRKDILAGRGEDLEARPDFKLASIVEVGQIVADVLMEMGWRFIHAPQAHRFITSDNPLVSEASEPGSKEIHFRMGVNLPNVAVWFPLTQTVCLIMQKGLTPGIGTTSGFVARCINKRIMICAERRIYAGEHSAGLQAAFNRHGCQVPIETLDLRYEGQKI